MRWQTKILERYRKYLCKRLRDYNYVVASIYFENPGKKGLPYFQKVEMIGNFSIKPWSVKIPLIYDQFFNAYQAVLRIRIGQQFKFVLNGSQYTTSLLYGKTKDMMGNENNVYDPSQFQEFSWQRSSRKSPSKVALIPKQKIAQQSGIAPTHDSLLDRILDHSGPDTPKKGLNREFKFTRKTREEEQQKAEDLKSIVSDSKKSVSDVSEPTIQESKTQIPILKDKEISQKANVTNEIKKTISNKQIYEIKVDFTDNAKPQKPEIIMEEIPEYQDFKTQFQNFQKNSEVTPSQKQKHYLKKQCKGSKQKSNLLTLPNIFHLSFTKHMFYQLVYRKIRPSVLEIPKTFNINEIKDDDDLLSPSKRSKESPFKAAMKASLAGSHAYELETIIERRVTDAFTAQEVMKEASQKVEKGFQPEFKLVQGAFSIGKTPTTCEDAFFICDRGFGIADGVSGWNDYGFSSSAFSHTLMQFGKEEIERVLKEGIQNQESKHVLKKMQRTGSYLSLDNMGMDDSQEEDEEEDEKETKVEDKVVQDQKQVDLTTPEAQETIDIHPIYILDRAYKRVTAVGSATACIGIRNQRDMHISNLGDSGFLLIRFNNGEAYTAKKSTEQQHYFNIPHQLTNLPGQKDLEILKKEGKIEQLKKLKAVLKKTNNLCQDKPEDSEEYQIELEDGDIIVTATDGIFDNLFNHEVLKICREYKHRAVNLNTSELAHSLAKTICEAAIEKVYQVGDKKCKTPFSRKYKKSQNQNWEGGKEDDITAIVTFVLGRDI